MIDINIVTYEKGNLGGKNAKENCSGFNLWSDVNWSDIL